MNTDTIKRFLTVLSSTIKIGRGQLYQLVQSAEVSYCLRDIESQREIGLLLQSFAYPFNQVGKYYESIYQYRSGQFEKARELLESVADSAPERYRSKALLSLSTVEQSIGHFEESLRLRLQSLSTNDPVTLIEAQRGIALLRSAEGDHRAALRDLERLMPFAHLIGKTGHPSYYAFLNSYALELSDSGKEKEAEQVARAVVASPYIRRYQEWSETLAEVLLKRKSRSTVSISGLEQKVEAEAPSNVLQFPTGEPMPEIEAILESDEVREELLLTPVQLLALILKVMLKDRITDEEVEKICLLYYDTLVKWYPVD